NSSVQRVRIHSLDERPLAACGLPASAAALEIAIGTVEPAVRAQEGVVKTIAVGAQRSLETMGTSFWRTYDRVLAGFDGVVLRIGTVPARLMAMLGAVQAVLPGAAVAGAAVVGRPHAVAPPADA